MTPCCRRCAQTEKDPVYGLPVMHTVMILCPECGNKRCPRATSHENKCSGDNSPGQAGSDYQ